jgi:hypothetical protein
MINVNNVLLAFFNLSMPYKMNNKTRFPRYESPKNILIPAQQPMESRFSQLKSLLHNYECKKITAHYRRK